MFTGSLSLLRNGKLIPGLLMTLFDACERASGFVARRALILVVGIGLSTFVYLCCPVTVGRCRFDSSSSEREGAAHKEEMGVRLGSERAAEGIGKPFGIFVSSSLLTAFLPDSCSIVEKDTSP
jgi:hypothetical protein